MSPRHKESPRFGRPEWVGLAFASPWLIGLLIFGIYPIMASLYFSLCRYNILKPPHFVGLENYHLLLTDDPLFWRSLANTLYLAAIGLPLQLGAALAAAMLLNRRVGGQSFYRTALYLPTIMPAVATSLLWVWILNPQYGLLNAGLGALGFSGPGWLTDPRWSKPALILVSVWGMGNTMVIFLAGLQQIPQSLVEAAIVDGANPWQRFRHITIPQLAPVILFNLVMGVIGSFQYFTQVYVMTAINPDGGGAGVGGPEFSTLVYPLYLYQNAFRFFRMGYASAMAWILFLLTALTLVIIFRGARYFGYEDPDETDR